LFICLTIVVVRNRRKTKEANKLLELKNADISQKAEQLRTTNEKLLGLSEFKDAMNSFLVHDLKNPLNTIINMDSRQNPAGYIAIVKKAGKQLLNLVMNILDISKYESNKLKISPKANSISEIINEAYSEIGFLAEQKSIIFKSNLVSDFVVNVDAAMIERVFINLFSNAIKFSKPGYSIQVFAGCVDTSTLKIIVKDNGEGIPQQYLSSVFDKFTQVRAKQSGFTPSSGIGLAFCKMTVEAHSGEIGVDSVVGEGTSFWFTLPIASETENQIKINPPAFIENAEPSMKTALVADETNLLTPYCDRLKKLSIYQISDVKDVVNSIDCTQSENIKAWKTSLLKALSDCNEIKYQELINVGVN